MCSVLNASSGELFYDKEARYVDSFDFWWTIAPSSGHPLQLDFWDLDTVSGNGVVSVLSCEDSGCASQQLVGARMSGAALGSFRSPLGLIRVHFSSASSARRESFRATWGVTGVGRCGDSFRDSGEECDDGNLLAADGCSAACEVEVTFSCSGATPWTGPDRCAQLIAAAGELTDGSGADPYSRDAFFEWRIVPPGANGMQLTFSEFDLEDGADWMYVYSCQDEACVGAAAGQIGFRISGTALQSFRSATGIVKLLFTSDGVGVRQGFAASWGPAVFGVCGDRLRDAGEGCDDGNSLSGDGCSAACAVETGFSCVGATASFGPDACMSLSLAQGTLHDGSGPNFYLDGVDFRWLIAPSSLTQLQLRFTSLDLEEYSDRVAVYTCKDSLCEAPELLGWPVSGAVQLPKFRSLTGFMMVHMTSDGNGVRGEGFEASWGPVAIGVCGDSLRDVSELYQVAESCDDGNTASGDGCSSSCAVEAGYSCVGATAQYGPDVCSRLNAISGSFTDGRALDPKLQIQKPKPKPLNLKP